MATRWLCTELRPASGWARLTADRAGRAIDPEGQPYRERGSAGPPARPFRARSTQNRASPGYGFLISIACSTGAAVLTNGSIPLPNWQATTLTSMGNFARTGNSLISSLPLATTAGP